MSCDCGNSAIGRWTGKVGGQLGDRLDSMGRQALSMGVKRFKTWTGLGDYKLNSNSLISGGISGTTGPIRIETRGRELVVSFREYLGEVYTGPVVGQFHAQTFVVNPANVKTFPWLAPIASQYDQYIPQGIIFEFKSTATDYTASSASLGSVIMASEYDVTDAPFTTKQQMLNSAYSQESKMSEDAAHGIECAPTETQRKLFYTRTLGTVVAGDVRDYDLCNFTIATQGGGLAANQSVGSIYVHYEFVFLKEQLVNGLQNRNLMTCTLTNDVNDCRNISETISTYRTISGYNPGISVGCGVGLCFDRSLQGSVWRIDFEFFASAATPVIPIPYFTAATVSQPATFLNCARLATGCDEEIWYDAQVQTSFPGEDPAFNFAGNYLSYPTQASSSGWLLLKLDDVMLEDARWFTALADVGVMFPGTAGTAAITQKMLITCTLVNPSYMTLNANELF